MKTILSLSIILLFFVYAVAMDSGKSNPQITVVPGVQAKVHDASNIYFTITNIGQLGSMGDMNQDPEWEGWTPGAEFPAGSEIDYLYAGAIWVGAEVDTVDEYGNPVLDTLVSVGWDGWWNVTELFPLPPDEQSLWEQLIFGDEEFFAVYYDTLTNPMYVPQDPIDQRPHIPLGLKITQNSFCWSSQGYDEIFILNYYLENIGGRDLHNVWFAIYFDGDVFHESESPFGNEEGIIDDICGFVNSDNGGIAWLADNNGQSYDGEYDSRSPVDVMCVALLGSTFNEPQTNFNWWMSHVDSEYDWGPQLQSNFDIWGPFPGGGRGTPGGDRARYQVMSNGEHDYDQIWAALDHTDEGWITSVPNVMDMANGFDTRYLISYGPAEIPAGETDTITIAYFGANNLHSDPSNYDNYLRYNTEDSLSIDQFYRNLDFSDMLVKIDSAFSYYSSDYINVPIGPPDDFRFDQWNESQITLRWKYSERVSLLEYRIYRGTEPGVYDPVKITPDGFVDSVFVDADIEDNTTYYYVISSASVHGVEGDISPEVFINSGQPQTPDGLTATSEQVKIYLSWNEIPDADLAGYVVYRSAPFQEFRVIDTAFINTYTDENVYIGQKYRYKITAIDTFGNESFFSDIVSHYAMGFDYGTLLVMANRTQGNPDYDSMAVFYDRMLSDFPHMIIDYGPQSMQQIASFSTVIYAKEQVLGYPYFDLSDNGDLIADYLEAGGNLLLAGTRLVAPSNTFHGQHFFITYDFAYQYLNLEGVEFPDVFNTEFIGGLSESPNYFDFAVDTARANRIEFPPVDNDGRLPGIGTLLLNDSSEMIFSYIAVEPETSIFHGNPIGMIHHTETYNTAVLEFPLYYAQEPSSIEIANRVLEELGEIRVGIDPDEVELPKTVELLQNYPNPFNAQTTIRFRLAELGNTRIVVYNIVGQQVALLHDGIRQAGEHSVRWNADDLPSGIYFAKLIIENERHIVKLVLLK
ncbi:MAG: T9SS type A sorting domain-containing protein [candidate division Zixibacteria bacterium]